MQYLLLDKSSRQVAIQAVLTAPDGYVCEVKSATRTTEQNKLLWAILRDVSSQVIWHGRKLTCEEWKDIFTATLKQQESIPGIDGGFVILGRSTRNMTKNEIADLIELIYAFGSMQEVKWKEPQVLKIE